MEQVIYTVKLDLTDNGCFDSGWRIKQGDNANSYLKVKVENNGVVYFNPLNLPEIVFHRPDGSTVVSVMSAGTDDFYTYTIVGNELAVAGNVVMDVKFTDSGRTSTASCTFLCVPDTISGDPSGASTYYNPISELIDQGEQIVDETDDNRLISEGYARGTQDGVEVQEGSPYYHNNAKYYMEQSSEVSNITWDRVQNKPFSTIGNNLTVDQNGALNASAGLTELEELYDVNINGPANGQVLAYNAVTQKWINSSSGGGGGLLPHLIVTTTTGSTVTATKGLTVVTLTETSTGQFEADIPEFGSWDIEASLSGSTATYTLTVDTVKIYTVSLGYFNATITVTFPANSTCSCGKTGETPQTASVSPHTFTVHSVGIYTITATDGTHTKSDTVTITTDGQSESITLTYVPDGSTVTPTDDIQIWLNCADIYDKTSYTTLSDILNDSTTLSALIADNNAVDYMVRSTTWASGVCADSTAMSYIGLNNYCANTLLADSDWLNAICNSAYFESVLNVKVPVMTSNTTPSGVVSVEGGSEQSSYPLYWAFDNNVNTWATIGVSANARLCYEFTAVKSIYLTKVITKDGGARSVKVQDWNGSSWADISSQIELPNSADPYAIVCEGSASKFGFLVLSSYQSNTVIAELQFYGRQDV